MSAKTGTARFDISNLSDYFEEEKAENPNKKPVSFGTTQSRGLFPHICAPDRTGNQLYPMKGAPNRGPGCYNNAEMTSFVHNLDNWICSNKGYTYGSRTASRFRKDFKTLTPSPEKYQTTWTKPRKFQDAYKPFQVASERFHQLTIDPMITPGPGVYEHEFDRNRHISWPQQFGSPMQPIQPNLDKKTLKTELLSDKEFRKFRNRVAYFRLYY